MGVNLIAENLEKAVIQSIWAKIDNMEEKRLVESKEEIKEAEELVSGAIDEVSDYMRYADGEPDQWEFLKDALDSYFDAKKDLESLKNPCRRQRFYLQDVLEFDTPIEG